MSLILDALRKSEHERQRQAGPGLAVVPESAERSRPATWLLVLGALLLLNIVVLAAVLLTGRPSGPTNVDRPLPVEAPPPAVQHPSATASPMPAPPPAVAREQPSRTAPVTLPARPPRNEVRPLTTEVAPGTAAAARRTEPPAPTGTDPAPPPAAASSPVVQQATDDARLPRFADLVVRGELNVPHMHVDIHVFSPAPAERFVFINMRKYGEGDSTQEGPRVERITPDGAVMDYQGQRFFLPRD